MRRLFILVIIFVGLGSPQLCAAQQAVLTTIRLVDSTGGQVEILATAPLTYAYYKAEPLQAVLDMAPATPSTSFTPDQLQSPMFSSVGMETKELVGATATRLVFRLKKEASFTVQRSAEDKGRLLVTFAPTAPQAGQVKPAGAADKELDDEVPAKAGAAAPAAAARETPAVRAAVEATTPAAATLAPAAEPTPVPVVSAPVPVIDKAEAEPAPSSPAPGKAGPAATLQPVVPTVAMTPPAVTAIRVGSDSIVIVTSGTVAKYNSFQLSKPRRLVIDIPGAKSGVTARQHPINRFGLVKARIGAYPDKVRIAFDGEKDTLSAYSVVHSAEGIVIRFKARK
jgi:type IV pilus assembly protein PilQ